MPFPVVTTFKTAGTYKKWQWPNSTHITYAWHVLLLWHSTSIHIYILEKKHLKMFKRFRVALKSTETRKFQLCPG